MSCFRETSRLQMLFTKILGDKAFVPALRTPRSIFYHKVRKRRHKVTQRLKNACAKPQTKSKQSANSIKQPG